MGFCGSRIPGHSGTDFKHRKAFVGIKTYTQKSRFFKNYYPEKLQSDPLPFEKRLQEKWLQKAIRFSTFFLILSAILFLFGMYSFTLMQNVVRSIESIHLQEAALKKAQNTTIICGYEYLSENQLELAIEEFSEVISMNEKHRAARVGLAEALVKLCNSNEDYCELAALNTKYVYDHKYAKVREIRSWFRNNN